MCDSLTSISANCCWSEKVCLGWLASLFLHGFLLPAPHLHLSVHWTPAVLQGHLPTLWQVFLQSHLVCHVEHACSHLQSQASCLLTTCSSTEAPGGPAAQTEAMWCTTITNRSTRLGTRFGGRNALALLLRAYYYIARDNLSKTSSLRIERFRFRATAPLKGVTLNIPPMITSDQFTQRIDNYM